MRKTHAWVTALMVPSYLATTVCAFAQKFHDPSSQELQMTSDPKAPGAAAVCLDREDETDFSNKYVSQYARIKILTEAGKSWAHFEISYDAAVMQPPVVEGRTIHPDGTISVMPKPGPFPSLDDRAAATLQVASFDLPDVTVGSVVEYRWILHIEPRVLPYPSELRTMPSMVGKPSLSELPPHYWSIYPLILPRWEIQEPIYTHHARFRFDPLSEDAKIRNEVFKSGPRWTSEIDGERCDFILHADRLPSGLQVQDSIEGEYTMEVHDIPALEDLPDALPAAIRAFYVQFYASPYPAPENYWNKEIKRWSKDLANETSPTKTLQDAVISIVGGLSDPEEKARRIYATVQSLNNHDFTPDAKPYIRRTWFQFPLKTPDEVWSDKGGSSNEIARLFLALCKAARLDAYGIGVADRARRVFDPNYLSLEQLDATLVDIHINGKDLYLDPGEKLCPFGQIAWNHALAGGISQASQETIHTPAGSLKDAVTARVTELTVDGTGGASGSLHVLMSGPQALYWRQFAMRRGEPAAQREFAELLQSLLPDGIKIESIQFKGLETSEGYLEATGKLSGPLGVVTEKRITIPAFLFSAKSQMQFANENRNSPMDFHFAEQVINDVKLHLPPGYTIDKAPQSTQLAWPGNAALAVTTTTTPGVLEVKHVFARAVVVLDPKDYSELRDYSLKVAANDKQQIVLVPQTASGN
ncbi:MAG TPA: DUF3857 domain-containing protein [Silvibacterium sp.]|nr:DUF3857 domain-containing protein [Silvibacterium sp.]